MEVDQTLVRRKNKLVIQDVIFVGTGMAKDRGERRRGEGREETKGRSRGRRRREGGEKGDEGREGRKEKEGGYGRREWRGGEGSGGR